MITTLDIGIITNLYWRQKAAARVGDQLTRPVAIQQGVRHREELQLVLRYLWRSLTAAGHFQCKERRVRPRVKS
ncbi:hypothetical protein ILUMI_25905 [Ignelater luminosus]|uniref:Uncharacterized protein n=1 Tax=Ignelater luminosus TaxID=2038154 RepID=A0A8K0C9L1_IGNLU|nr:hypothetical protein ILUMI_25905 [Ignelater luminosus]